MRISIVLVQGARQIMMIPETDHEKAALKFIMPNDDLRVVSRWGTFGGEYQHSKLQVDHCNGGYLRAFSNEESLMLLIEDRRVLK